MALLTRPGSTSSSLPAIAGNPVPTRAAAKPSAVLVVDLWDEWHPAVLSVGAVRADGLPLALSAQGPGRLAARLNRAARDYGRALNKPDLCAPSHFRESDDATETNTGTSAACGFVGGIVAALRGIDPVLRPARLRAILRATAQPVAGKEWDPRLGYGVIDGAAALATTENLHSFEAPL